MDDLGWTVVGVLVLVVACAIAGWGAFELQDPPARAPSTLVAEEPAPVPPAEMASSDVDRFYATAYRVVCPLEGAAAASSGGAFRLKTDGVEPSLWAVADTLAHDAGVSDGKLILLVPPGATAAVVQLDGYGELSAEWKDAGPAGPEAPPTPCTSLITTTRSAQVSGRVLDPRGSNVVADCVIRMSHVEDDPPRYSLDVPIGRACRLQLMAADGRRIGPPRTINVSGTETVDLP